MSDHLSDLSHACFLTFYNIYFPKKSKRKHTCITVTVIQLNITEYNASIKLINLIIITDFVIFCKLKRVKRTCMACSDSSKSGW